MGSKQQQNQQIPSSPLPNQQSSSLLRDISNFKTPKPTKGLSQTNPSSNFESPCPQFFSALKQTPKSSYYTVRRTPRYSLAARKLKAVEVEQSKSSRKTQTNKEKSLKSLAKSLTVWLNFLFENPRFGNMVTILSFYIHIVNNTIYYIHYMCLGIYNCNCSSNFHGLIFLPSICGIFKLNG